MNRYILPLSCPAQKGILATVSHRLFKIGGNILENAQCTEMKSDTFCMRSCFEIDDVDLNTIKSAIGEVASEFSADFTLREEDNLPKVLIMVSQYDHCLLDLFYKKRTGELPIEIPIVVSNHEDLKDHADDNGAVFQHIPITPETRQEAEQNLLSLVDQYEIDFIVLALSLIHI